MQACERFAREKMARVVAAIENCIVARWRIVACDAWVVDLELASLSRYGAAAKGVGVVEKFIELSCRARLRGRRGLCILCCHFC